MLIHFVYYSLPHSSFLFSAPPIIKHDFVTEQHIPQGDNWSVVCPVSGFPPPMVYWVKDGEILVDDDIKIHIKNEDLIANARMTIFDVTIEDQGQYKCYANSSRFINGTSSVIRLLVNGMCIMTLSHDKLSLLICMLKDLRL